MLRDRPTLVADEVKRELLAALEPLWGAILAGLEGADVKIAEPEEILFLVQLSPAVVQIVREAKGGRAGGVLIRAPFGMLPDDGEALRDALLAYIAGVVSAHEPDAARAAMLYARAAQGRGGFLLVVWPITANTRLFLAREGEDLSRALDLGGVGEAVSWN